MIFQKYFDGFLTAGLPASNTSFSSFFQALFQDHPCAPNKIVASAILARTVKLFSVSHGQTERKDVTCICTIGTDSVSLNSWGIPPVNQDGFAKIEASRVFADHFCGESIGFHALFMVSFVRSFTQYDTWSFRFCPLGPMATFCPPSSWCCMCSLLLKQQHGENCT